MSRARSYAYAAPTQPPSSPACYYYDDREGYIGDYSESDGLSDGTTHMIIPTPPDVTEIYRRKAVPGTVQAPLPPSAAQVDYHAMYAAPEYYYDPVTPQGAVPRRAGVAYRKRVPVVGERTRYYSADSGELYESMPFRSTHQMMPTVARHIPPRVPSATAVRQTSVRRHPITVRTPRYYRRPGSTTLFKRPSALCLPLASQPDPAVYKRSKRSSSDKIYTPEYVYQPQTTKISYPVETAKGGSHKVPQGTPSDYTDLNVSRSKLDAALQRYEQIFGPDAAEYPEVKIARMLKPKVPQTIKEKQQQDQNATKQNDQVSNQQDEKPAEENYKSHSMRYPQIDWSKARILEVESAESDALEKMLFADLKANGFAGSAESDEPIKVEKQNKPPSRIPSKVEKKPDKSTRNLEAEKVIPLKNLPKSFNYQEIQNVVTKTKQHQLNQHSQQQAELEQYQNSTMVDNLPSSKKSSRNNSIQGDAVQMSDSTYSRPTSAQGYSQVSSKRQQSTETLDKSSDTNSVRTGVVPRILVDDALELHRTKSYVVDLIDHALSNHLGTNFCEKYSTKDNPLDPRVAVELLKKHSTTKVNKDICLEIAQALANTFNNSSTNCSSATPVESKQETSACSCNKNPEEPLYVKQLKQLRWGHLKHIQREVRRLQDLERFLDSCSTISFSKGE